MLSTLVPTTGRQTWGKTLLLFSTRRTSHTGGHAGNAAHRQTVVFGPTTIPDVVLRRSCIPKVKRPTISVLNCSLVSNRRLRNVSNRVQNRPLKGVIMNITGWLASAARRSWL